MSHPVRALKGVMRGVLVSSLSIVATASLALEITVHDQAGQPLADAVVFAVPSGVRPTFAAGTAIIDQVDKQFVPRVSAIAAGTTVTFPNKDDIKHQVYSFSPAKVFQLKLYHGVAAAPVVFDKAGLVVMGCNIHDGMVGYVYVVEAPYFALADANGHVNLAELPRGTYRVEAWHYRMLSDPAPKTLMVAIGATTPSLELTVTTSAEQPALPALE